MLWVWVVSLPVTVLNSPAVTAYTAPRYGTTAGDIVGLLLWVVGFGLEAVADVQKFRHRMRGMTGPEGAVCDTGLFACSRHPNYFGEILLQFGIFMVAVVPASHGAVPRGSGASAALYASIVGPVFLTVLLLFVSGLNLQERPGAKRRFERDGPAGPVWTRYRTWLERTSILIPFPPGLYVRLPVWVKRTVFLEFPIYVFDPVKHAGAAPGKTGQGQEGAEAVEAEGVPGVERDSRQQQQEQQQQVRSESGEALV